MFENDISVARGHVKGLITDGSVYPDDSVIDCLNIDFFETEDRRRLPYSLKVNGQEEFLLPGYKIIGFYEKEFTDGNNETHKVLVVVTKHNVMHDIKIYLNKYYNPSSKYGNRFSEDIELQGWIDQWTEITECYVHSNPDDPLTYAEHVDNDPDIYRYTTTAGGNFDKETGYFNGFWIYYQVSSECIGQIIDFTNESGTQTFTVAINSRNTTSTISQIITGSTSLNRIYITRFPVNVFAGKLLRNKIEISSVSNDNPALISMTSDHGIEIGDVVGVDEVEGMTEINGLYLTVIGLEDDNTIIVDFDGEGASLYTGGGRIEGKNEFQDLKTVSFEENFNAVKICLGKVIRPLEVSFLQERTYNATPTAEAYIRSWNGFYFAYDIPNIADISNVIDFDDGAGIGGGLTYYYGQSVFGREIGVRLKVMPTTEWIQREQDYLNVIVGFCINIDGYQKIFLKYIKGGRYYAGGKRVYTFTCQVHFLCDFDRRITDICTFMEAYEPFVVFNKREIISYQLDKDYNGLKKLSDSTSVQGTNNYYYIAMQPISPIYKDYANGITMNSALNEKYYHSPVSAFRLIFRMNQNLIGIDLSDKYLATDSQQKDSYGTSKIVISNVQFGADGESAINAESCYGEERIRHLIQGQRITAGSSTIANQFSLFTESHMYNYELSDDVSGKINLIRTYQFAGTYNENTVVRAKIMDNFAGLYYMSNSTIYRFLDNAPEDLLFNKWRDEYQAMSETDKRNAIAGYMPYTKEVYFVIGETIYVWNIIYENWKKYSFRDIPTQMISSVSGQIYFTDGNNIYAQETLETTLFNDITSDGVSAGISFMIRKRLTHGSRITQKIPDRIDLSFEADSENSDNIPLEISIGRNGKDNDILDSYQFNMIDVINEEKKGKKSLVLGEANNSARSRSNYYDLTLKYTHPGDGSPVKYFKLTELIVNAKKALRQLTKI